MKLRLTLRYFSASVVESSGSGIPPTLRNESYIFSFIFTYALRPHISSYLSLCAVKKLQKHGHKNCDVFFIVSRPVFIPMRTCSINVKIIFLFSFYWPQNTNILKINIFNNNRNNVFTDFFWNTSIKMSFTTRTYNLHTHQLFIILTSKLIHEHRKRLQNWF